MRVIITHERSGIVREAFRALGHDCHSCDLAPAEDNSPHHIQGDALEILQRESWDFAGIHPECTYLSVSGIHWNSRIPGREKRTAAALAHVRSCWELIQRLPRGYMENPVSILSTHIRKPDQIIQPYQFGEDAAKATCLWLHNLPRLNIDPARRFAGRIVTVSGKTVERWGNQTDSGQNRLGPSPDRAINRARTYRNIAIAMAEQWGKV